MTKKKTSQKIFRNALANYCGLGFNLIIVFFLSPFLVHTLGDTKYGIWSIVMSLTGYMSLMDLGIATSLTRFVSKYHKTKETNKLLAVVNSGLGLFTLVSIFIVVLSPLIAWGFTHFFTFDSSMVDVVFFLIIVISFDISLFIISGAFRGIFFGLQRYDIVNINLIIMGAYKALLFYLFLSKGYGLLAMGIISLSGKALMLIIYYFFVKNKYPFIQFSHKRISRRSMSTIMNYAVFSSLSLLANQLINYTDSFVIGFFLNVAAVTYYSIAASLIEYAKRICQSISQVFIPAVSEYEAVGDFEKIQNLWVLGTKYLLIISSLFCIGLISFGEAFINLWMGSQYGEICAPIIIILAVAQLTELPQLISRAVLFGLSKHKFTAYSCLAASIINLILSIVLIKKYGLIGVALGTSIPQIILYGFFFPHYTARALKMSLYFYIQKTYGRVVIPSLILLLSLKICLSYLYPLSYFILMLESVVCGLVYLYFSYLFTLDAEEKIKVKFHLYSFKNKFRFA